MDNLTLFGEDEIAYANGLMKRLQHDLEASFKVRERSTLAIAFTGGIGLLWLDGFVQTCVGGHVWWAIILQWVCVVVFAYFIIQICFWLYKIFWPIDFALVPTPPELEKFRKEDGEAVKQNFPNKSEEEVRKESLQAFIANLEEDVDFNFTQLNYLSANYGRLVKTILLSVPIILVSAISWKLPSELIALPKETKMSNSMPAQAGQAPKIQRPTPPRERLNESGPTPRRPQFDKDGKFIPDPKVVEWQKKKYNE